MPDALPANDSGAVLARRLAPVLYLQRDETFPLSRVVAVLHPTRRIIAYHLLWRDDAHGAWLPFTKPTDEEVVWVEYDATGKPVELWTFWHGDLLHADWRSRGEPAFDVQWGKHGSLPRNTVTADLPFPRTMEMFWLAAWVGLPDIWLGNAVRKGPWCFCHGYGRYTTFDRPMPIAPRIDLVIRAERAGASLLAVFGRPYSKKREWPF